MLSAEDSTVELIRALSKARLPFDDEKRLQARMLEVIVCAGIPVEREARVAGGVIDFLFPFGVGIEVKISGSASAIRRQLERYSKDERIHTLILATSKSIHLPDEIGGTRVIVLDLGRAWL